MKALRVLFYTLIASTGGLLFGYETAIMSGTILMIQKDFELDEKLTSLLVTCLLIGAVVGSIVGGKISERLGRKRTIYIGLVGVGIGGVMGLIFPKHFDIFLSTRIIAGIGLGMIFMTIPVYIAEIAPAKLRGSFGAFFHIFIGLGLTCGFYLCYNFSYFRYHFLEVEYGWRWLYFIEFPLALILAFLIAIVPESPRWLLFNRRGREAKEILDKITSEKNENKIIADVSEIMDLEKREVEESSGLGFAVKLKDTIITVISLPFLSQITGVSVIIYYAIILFQDISSKTMRISKYEMVIIGIAYMIGAILTMFLVDLAGRKIIMILGAFLMAVGAFQVGVSMVVKEMGQVSGYMMLIYIIAQSFSVSTITTIYISEILPDGVKGYGMGIAGMFFWFSGVFAEFVFPLMQSTHPLMEKLRGSIPFFFFGIFAIVLLIFSFSLRETKGKSLEELEEDWYKLDRSKLHNKFYR
jgi:sugar porter (SP) family MFS transporter